MTTNYISQIQYPMFFQGEALRQNGGQEAMKSRFQNKTILYLNDHTSSNGNSSGQ